MTTVRYIQWLRLKQHQIVAYHTVRDVLPYWTGKLELAIKARRIEPLRRQAVGDYLISYYLEKAKTTEILDHPQHDCCRHSPSEEPAL